MPAVHCTDLNSVAAFLGFAPQHVYYLVQNADRMYTSIEIPKRRDKNQKRIIDIPYSELKGIQRAINKKVLSRFAISEHAHSYVAGKSILTATRNFCGGKAVLEMDIEKFFPSITFSRVMGLFVSLGFNHNSAFILSKLCTKDNILCQGSPTSPTISNLILRKLDTQLFNISQKWELGYLRYSDDLFFYQSRNFNHPQFSNIVTSLVRYSGFKVNVDKTIFHPRGKPRITLGLLTHGDNPRIPGLARKKYRSMFYKASTNLHWAQENKILLKGILEWHQIVNGKDETYHRYKKIYDNIDLIKLHYAYKSI